MRRGFPITAVSRCRLGSGWRIFGGERAGGTLALLFFENHLLADYPGCLLSQPSQLSIQTPADTDLPVFDYAVLRQRYDECPAYERFGRVLAEYHLLGTDARLVEQLTCIRARVARG